MVVLVCCFFVYLRVWLCRRGVCARSALLCQWFTSQISATGHLWFGSRDCCCRVLEGLISLNCSQLAAVWIDLTRHLVMLDTQRRLMMPNGHESPYALKKLWYRLLSIELERSHLPQSSRRTSDDPFEVLRVATHGHRSGYPRANFTIDFTRVPHLNRITEEGPLEGMQP